MPCTEQYLDGGVMRERPCGSPVGAPPAYATPTPRSGPGAELSAILKDWLGIEASPTCSCRAMAAKMDALGEEWCEGPGMPEILAVMRAEHAKRRLLIPWSDMAAAAMVRLACWRSRSKREMPGGEMGSGGGLTDQPPQH